MLMHHQRQQRQQRQPWRPPIGCVVTTPKTTKRTTMLLIIAAIVASEWCGSAAGVSISIRNNVIVCDGLQCPAGSATCRVTRDSAADRRLIAVVRQCKRADGSVAAELKSTEPNVGGRQVNSVNESSVGGSGTSIVNIDGGSSSSSESHSSSSASSTTTTSSTDDDIDDDGFFSPANAFSSDIFQTPQYVVPTVDGGDGGVDAVDQADFAGHWFQLPGYDVLLDSYNNLD